MNQSKLYIIILLFLLTGYFSTQAQEAIADSTIVEINIEIKDSTISIDDSALITKKDTLQVDSIPKAAISRITDSIPSQNDSIFTDSIIPIDSVRFSLNGYLFNSTDTVLVEKWKYNTDIHNFDFFSYDSTLNEFHITHPAYRNSINNTYLANSGLAVKSNIYFESNPETGYLFLNSFTPYMHQANATTYYNTQKPFTLFGYQTGPKEEQNIELIHTQNVNPHLNGFFQFNNYSSKGHYEHQQTKNNSGTFGGAHIRGRFATHVSFSFSRINTEENGGIVDPFYIQDTSLSPAEVSTKLSKGTNYIKDKQWFIDQKIGFVKSRKRDTNKTGGFLFSIQYNYQRQNSWRIYEDDSAGYYNPITDKHEYLYQNNYSNSTSFDTSGYSHNRHLVRINLEEAPGNSLGFGAYIGAGKHSANYQYYNKDTVFTHLENTTIHSTFLEGGIFRLRPSSSLHFYGHYQYFIKGYRKNDVSLSGMISVKAGKGLFHSEVTVEGKTESKTNDYFLTKYRSNHFKWDNNFDKENVTELKVKYKLPKLKTEIGARYALLTNYIYYDSLALPSQFANDFNVLDIYFDNAITIRGFNLLNKVNYQQSGKQEVLPLPKLSTYNALYYEHNITFPTTQGKMQIQLGVDVNYWTAFYAPAYSPATAQFHMQNKQLVGDYPFFGAFVNIEIKRMRIYIKGEHINYSIMANDNANYFTAPNYPTPKMVFKYGLTWTFYD